MTDTIRHQDRALPPGPAMQRPDTPRSPAGRPASLRESEDLSRIAPALVRAQAAMENPARNRTVQVRAQGGTYAFRYATLDRITDMARRVLAENGLCVLQPIVSTPAGTPALLTRLLHESGQWIESEVPLPPLGPNPQAFGSVVTYIRRYALSAMLNIAPDEDDDANRAAGHHYAESPPAPRRATARATPAESGPTEIGPTEIGEVVGEAVARVLLNRARLAEGVAEGHALLEDWTRRMAVLDQLRGTRAWEALERELGAGLKRSLGTEPAAAFVAALRATEPAHVEALQQAWEGRWAGTLSAMQQEAPATYALLRRHLAAQIARVRAGGSRGAEGPAPAPAAPFEAPLRDAEGDAISPPFTDPIAFARAYAEAWTTTPAEARSTLARRNVKALGQAARHAEARAVLDRLGEETEAVG